MQDESVIPAGQKVEILMGNETSKHKGQSLYITADESSVRKIFWEYPDELIHLYDDAVTMSLEESDFRRKAINGNWIEF